MSQFIILRVEHRSRLSSLLSDQPKQKTMIWIRMTVAIPIMMYAITTADGKRCSNSGGGYVFIPDNDHPGKEVDPKTLVLGIKSIVLKAILLSSVLQSNTDMMPMLPTTMMTTAAAAAG